MKRGIIFSYKRIRRLIMKGQKSNVRQLDANSTRTISCDDVIGYLKKNKEKLDEPGQGISTVSLKFPDSLMKRINRRMAKKKRSSLNDYFLELVIIDLEGK